MRRKKDSNTEPIYDYEGSRVTITPFFLYEISIYEVTPNRFDIRSNKFYASKKILDIPELTVLKTTKDYILEREVVLLGVPTEFIEENKLPIYNSEKYEKRKSRNSGRVVHRRK